MSHRNKMISFISIIFGVKEFLKGFKGKKKCLEY